MAYKFTRHPFFIKLNISYFLIILTALSLVFINLYRTSLISNQQDEEYYAANLMVVKDLIDSQIANVRNMFLQIANNNRLEIFRFDNQLARGDALDRNFLDSYDAYEAINELSHYRNTVNGVQIAGIFYKGADIVVDNFSLNPAVEYFKQILKIDGMEAGNWYSLASSYQNFGLLPSARIVFNQRLLSGATFYTTFPANDSNVKGLIFAVMSRDVFVAALERLKTDGNTYALMMDENGRTISHTGNFNDSIPLLPYHALKEQITPSGIEASGFMYYASKINSMPWKIVLITRTSPFSVSAFSFTESYLLLLIVILALSLLLSFVLSFYSYKPLRQLFESLIAAQSRSMSTRRIARNEFAEIERNISEIKQRNAALYTAIDQYSHSLEYSYLYDLIRRKPISVQYEAIVRRYARLSDDGNAAFSLLIRISGQIERRMRHKMETEIQKFLKTKVQTVASVHDDNGDLYGLAWMLQETDSLESKFDSFIELLYAHLAHLENKYNTRITAGVSGLCRGSDDIAESYERAHLSLQHGILLPHRIHVCGEYSPYISLELPLQTKARLRSYLQTGRYEPLRELIAELLAPYEDRQARPTRNVPQLYYELCAILMQHIREGNFADHVYDKMRWGQLHNFGDILGLCKELCDGAAAAKDSKKGIVAFIDRHYTDPNMSLQMIKDQFHISYALITRTIKQETGFGFLEYISRLRIEYAKQLLQGSSSETLNTIRESCGFTDNSTFIKVFKKYAGSTPGDYKKNHAGANKRVQT